MNADAQVLAIVRSLAAELKPGTRDFSAFGADHHLERDFGLDSLARVELFARIERAAGHGLGEAAFAAETPAALLRLIDAAGSPVSVTPAADVADDVADDVAAGEQATTFHPAPDDLETLTEVLDWHVQHQPVRTHIHLLDEGPVAEPVSYRQLAAHGRCPSVSRRSPSQA